MGTLLCLISLFLWTSYDIGEIDKENHDNLIKIDITIGVIFLTELILNICTNYEGILITILKLENLVDAGIIFEIFWRVFDFPESKVFIFFSILRSLRVLKLRQIIKIVT